MHFSCFQAHRVVLASISDYFRVMFTSEVRESRLKEITLEGVSARGIQFLLDYAYTSRLSLNLANIQDVLATASHVQVSTVVEACSSYLQVRTVFFSLCNVSKLNRWIFSVLQAQLDLDNCVDIVTLAETYSLSQLRKRVYRFICGHLMDFSQTPDFQRLSVVQLEHLLSCDHCVDCTEAEVLQIVLQWIEFDPSRIQYSTSLLSKIHFDVSFCTTKNYIISVVELKY